MLQSRCSTTSHPASYSTEIKTMDNSEVCTLNSTLHSQLANEVDKILNGSILPQLYGIQRNIPASSCVDIYQGHPSGYYCWTLPMNLSWSTALWMRIVAVVKRWQVDANYLGIVHLDQTCWCRQYASTFHHFHHSNDSHSKSRPAEVHWQHSTRSLFVMANKK